MKNNIIKYLIIAVSFVILAIVAIIIVVKDGDKSTNNNNEVKTSNIIENTTGENIYEEGASEQDISEVWHEINDLDDYRLFTSLETYMQKYFEKNENKPMENFSNYNVDDIWCYNKVENENEIDEYYINGYVCNNNFTEIKPVATKFTVYNENNSYNIEILGNVDFSNTTWESFISGKEQEIQSNWETIKSQNKNYVDSLDMNGETGNVLENDTLEEDENTDLSYENEAALINEAQEDEVQEEKPAQYSESTFGLLECTDKHLINRFFINYKIKVLANKQKAYEMLSENTKDGLLTSYQEFESEISKYINSNTNIAKIKIIKSILDEDNNTNEDVKYIMADNNSQIYGIEIKALNNYTFAIKY